METYFTLAGALCAVGVALLFITLMPMVRGPYRQTINALIIAGAPGILNYFGKNKKLAV